MSFISSATSSSLFAASVDPSTTPTLRPFANLDLTEDQPKQIRTIFQQAKSQGLSQTQVQQQINAVLTPDQQAQLQSNIQSLQNQPSQGQQSGGTPPNPFDDPNGPFANLKLTDAQKTAIDGILQQVQAGTLSQSDGLAQMKAQLTPTQANALSQDVQTARSSVSGHHHHHHGGGEGTTASSSSTATSTASLSNGVTVGDIQNQVAAATSVILNQLQHDVGGATS